MNKIFIKTSIFFIKLYKYFFSPLLGNKCRFFPSCSEYLIESLETHGILKGLGLGLKRMCKCHPLKILGGSSGVDLVPKKECLKKKY